MEDMTKSNKYFTSVHFLPFFYRFKSMTINIDYINYNFILFIVKKNHQNR